MIAAESPIDSSGHFLAKGNNSLLVASPALSPWFFSTRNTRSRLALAAYG
jgi:hypothetical protein